MSFIDALRDVTGALEQTFSPETYFKKQALAQQAANQQYEMQRNALMDQYTIAQKNALVGQEQEHINQMKQSEQDKKDAAARSEGLRQEFENISKLPPEQQQAAALAAQAKYGQADKAISSLAEPKPPVTQLVVDANGQYQQVTKTPNAPPVVNPVGVKAPPKGSGILGNTTVGLSPEAITAAAEQYHLTGVLPNVGMAGKADKEAIMNKERELYKGSSGNDMVVNKTQYKANSLGLNALTKDLTAIAPYKEMLDKNADIAVNLAKKITKTDSTLANKPINWLAQNVTGNPDVAEYLAQIQIFQTESARVLNNPRLVGQLTDSARHEMQGIISGDMPLESTIRVIERIKSDGSNRVNAMKAAQQSLVKSIGLNPQAADTPKAVHWDDLK